MKTKITLLVVLLSVIVSAFVSIDTFQTTTGPHDGRLRQAGNFNIESKISQNTFYAYLMNKQSKPISNKGITCEMRFLFADSTSIDVPLKPYMDDGFKIESSISGYDSYRVNFNAFGKYISAKFENENAIVRKK